MISGSLYHGFASLLHGFLRAVLNYLQQIGSLAHTLLNCSITFYGIGRHLSVQLPENAVRVLVISYATRLLYQCILATTKIAILTLYLRIFTDARSQCMVYGMISFVVLYTLPCLLLLIFECTPFYDSWNPYKFPQTCINLTIQVYMSAGFNIFLDLLMVAFAVPRVRKSLFSPGIYWIVALLTLKHSAPQTSKVAESRTYCDYISQLPSRHFISRSAYLHQHIEHKQRSSMYVFPTSVPWSSHTKIYQGTHMTSQPGRRSKLTSASSVRLRQLSGPQSAP